MDILSISDDFLFDFGILISRLRDLSVETETEQRRKIGELERDLSSVDELQGTDFHFLFCDGLLTVSFSRL